MKVLVLGGTGHTGERLVRRFLAAGHAVTVLSRRDPGKDEVLGRLVELGARHAPGDATAQWALFAAAEGQDAMFSCAHIRYAGACIRACQQGGISRYLQMSSTRRFTAYPCPSSREVIGGEEAISDSGLRWTILRPTMIFGGRRDANLERVLQWFRRRAWFPCFGGGHALVQPVFVEDLADALAAALENPGTERRAFTLAGPEPLTYGKMLWEVARAAGVKEPRLIGVPHRPALLAARLLPDFIARRALTAEQIQRFLEDKDADISEAGEVLGFSPRPFRDAMALKAAGRAEPEAGGGAASGGGGRGAGGP